MADSVKGVDISVWNGDVDFEMLKRNGISFVMIGMGKRFAENVQKQKRQECRGAAISTPIRQSGRGRGRTCQNP